MKLVRELVQAVRIEAQHKQRCLVAAIGPKPAVKAGHPARAFCAQPVFNGSLLIREIGALDCSAIGDHARLSS